MAEFWVSKKKSKIERFFLSLFYDITLITLFFFSNFYLACDMYVKVCSVFRAIAQPCTQLACLSHDGSSKLTRLGFHRKNILFASIFEQLWINSQEIRKYSFSGKASYISFLNLLDWKRWISVSNNALLILCRQLT